MSLSVALSHSFGDFALDVAFDAGPGVTALFGRSGAGKSSVINAVAGLLTPDRGRVQTDGTTLLDTANGTNLPPHQRRLGCVFQDARLFPHLSVRENLAFGARYAPRGATVATLDQVAKLLGLERLLDRGPASLSGGEKQRVAIGRALLSGPRMLLMDEPLASLDVPRRHEILPFLERLRDAPRPLPILYVSHALDEVARLADTLVLLQEGRVAAQGPLTQVLADPAMVPLIGAREAGAVVTARVDSHAQDGLTALSLSAATLQVPRIDAAPGTRVRLRVRAHDVILSMDRPDGLSALNVLPVVVDAVHEGQGPGAIILLRTGDDRLLARVTTRALQALRLKSGVHCHAIVKATSVAPGSIGQARGSD